MRAVLAVLLAMLVGNGRAATAYVTDELVLGVYADPSTQGQRLATLHSGASVDTSAVNGDSTQVRLPDGRSGWVKTSYLTSREPAAVRVKQLQEELDRTRTAAPGLAQAAEHSEVLRLTRELAARQPGTDAVVTATAGLPAAAEAGPAAGAIGQTAPAPRVWVSIAAVLLGTGCGFWAGYAALARRIRVRFGGIKVY